MKNSITKSLQAYGLTETESAVYLANLELGQARVTTIAKQADVNRNTVYSVLERLEELGLVFPVMQGKIQQYRAEDLKTLILESKKRAEAIKEIFPELQELFRRTHIKPEVQYYRGLDGIKQIYEGVLKERNLKSYSILSSESTWMSMDPKFFSDFLKRRAAKKIFTRLILEESSQAREHQRLQKEYLGEVKILPNGSEQAFVGGVYIFPHRVVFIAQKQEWIAVAIQSQEIRDTLQFMFDFMWERL